MAAPSAEVSVNSSSSSDDEQLKRCQEAVWDSPAVKDASSNKNPSKRLIVADHNHDGNELQVTRGFQIHVAQKLGAMLDSFISEKQSTPRPGVNTETTDNTDDDDEGFRLFSTSVPGQKLEEPPPPKRRPIPSSSDSDSEMEMRFKEAAISIKDILPQSTSELPTTPVTPETPSLETNKKIKKKIKKKRKPNPEENGQGATKCTRDNLNKQTAQDDEAQTAVKSKKKKKKKKKKRTLGNSDVAVPCFE